MDVVKTAQTVNVLKPKRIGRVLAKQAVRLPPWTSSQWAFFVLPLLQGKEAVKEALSKGRYRYNAEPEVEDEVEDLLALEDQTRSEVDGEGERLLLYVPTLS